MKLLSTSLLLQNLCNPMGYAEFLKRTRTAAGLTQGKLAELISARGHNVTVSSISNIERAYYRKQDGTESQPHKKFVVLAAEVCGVDVNDALKEADYAPTGSVNGILEGFDALSREDQELASRQIKAIIEIFLSKGAVVEVPSHAAPVINEQRKVA